MIKNTKLWFLHSWYFLLYLLCVCMRVEIGRDTGASHSEVHRRENDVDLSWISGRAASAESRLPTSPSCHGKHQHRLRLEKNMVHFNKTLFVLAVFYGSVIVLEQVWI